MGEKAGHPFRGNQYGSGKGGGIGGKDSFTRAGETAARAVRAERARRAPRPEGERLAAGGGGAVAARRGADVNRPGNPYGQGTYTRNEKTGREYGPGEYEQRMARASSLKAERSAKRTAFKGLTKDTDSPEILKRADQLRTGKGLSGMDKWGLKPDLALARARQEVGMGRLALGLKRAR